MSPGWDLIPDDSERVDEVNDFALTFVTELAEMAMLIKPWGIWSAMVVSESEEPVKHGTIIIVQLSHVGLAIVVEPVVVYLRNLAWLERLIGQQRTLDTVFKEESPWQREDEALILEDGLCVPLFVVEAGTGVTIIVVEVIDAQGDKGVLVELTTHLLVLDVSDPEGWYPRHEVL